MDPKTTALLMIEYQNDFMTDGGAQHAAVAGVMAQTNMLAHSRRVMDEARTRGVMILHAPISFADGYPEVPSTPYGILAGIVSSNAFRKGSWGAEIADAMSPVDGDIVVEGKRGLDCFASANLDFILRQRNVTNLAIAGFLTNCCVESTMRSAYERGYQVMTLTDCTATLSVAEQEAAVTKNFPMFSRPMTHDRFLAGLETSGMMFTVPRSAAQVGGVAAFGRGRPGAKVSPSIAVSHGVPPGTTATGVVLGACFRNFV